MAIECFKIHSYLIRTIILFLYLGNYKFEDVHVQEAILTETINDIDMKTLIPLRTEQEIPKMFINDLHAEDNIRVEGLISGYKIRDEVQNSLTVNKQFIH